MSQRCPSIVVSTVLLQSVHLQLKNMAIANALQLEAAEVRQTFHAIITTSCQVWSRWTYQLPYYSVVLIYYFTLWPWPLTMWPLPLIFDLEHLQRIACDVMKLSTKFEGTRAIRGGVNAIAVFDLMTLNIAVRVAVGSGIIFPKFDLRQLIRAWIIACWYVMSRGDLDFWPVDLESSWYIRRHVASSLPDQDVQTLSRRKCCRRTSLCPAVTERFSARISDL